MTGSPRESLHEYAALRRLIAPASVAIVGASPKPGSFSANLAENCRSFAGDLYFVNPAYPKIGEVRCYASLSELPVVPDCVVIAVKRDLVEDVVVECARLGVGGAIIFASGFGEIADQARKAEQDRIVDIGRRGGVLIAGPNTVGSSNFTNGAILTFSPEMLIQRSLPNAVGVVSQSGAVGNTLAQAMHHGANISHVLICGNSADVDVADYVGYLAEDDGCGAIVCMIEGMDNPRRLLLATERARASGKPLILFKAARSEVGAAAAMSHTGSIAGSHRSYVAAMQAAGAVVIDDPEALYDTAAFLAKAGTPKSEGVAIITASGGWGIVLADQAEAAGVALPPLPDHTRETLRSIIPEFGSAANPCDVTAQILSNRPSLAAAAGALLDEDRFGLLVWPQAWTTAGNADGYRDMIAAMGDAARTRGKIACMVWTTQWLEGPGVASAERNDSVAVFRSARHCFEAIRIWHGLARARSSSQTVQPLTSESAAANAREMLSQTKDDVIGERAAKAILATFGISVVEERLAATADDAARLASVLGFPVVLKVDSPDLPHKSEAGAVRLNLGSAEEVCSEARSALKSVAEFVPHARIDGLLVQRMVTDGVEMLIGTKMDPHFGPMVVAGFGGILAEVVSDVAMRPAPVGVEAAKAMLDELRCRRILDGVRNLPKVNIERLAEAIARISELAVALSDEIAEIDVNPLICSGDDIIAADALIVRRQR